MRAILRCAFAAIVVAFCAQQAAAQSLTGCPPGQAMQASSPSGKQVTCVPIPDMGSVNNAINNEAVARANADADLSARISALSERDIVGKWTMTGTTNCIQALNGFTGFSPSLPPSAVPFNVVSLLTGDFAGTTEFFAGGMGRTVGTSHVITSAATVFANGVLPPGTPTNGGASVATLDSNFNWTLDSDGKVTIDHPDPIVQPLITVGPGQTATIIKLPAQVGHLSKDKRTITLTHETMTLETSVRNVTPPVSTPRFCSRVRVLTRLP